MTGIQEAPKRGGVGRPEASITSTVNFRTATTLGPERLRALEDDLRTMAPGAGMALDVPGWFT